jgi:tyrosine-protein kinase Etk/Wzc
MPLLAHVSATDIAIESLRNFRTALQFSMSQAENNIVLITGATPELGKTFVSVNLAAITAITGKKVLLIDADLRNGHLHHYFGLTDQDGLSNFLSGKIELKKIIHREVIPHMDFISTGSLPFNPSELLLDPRFGGLLQSLSSEYDLILIDTTPILFLSDTIVIGSHAGTIYMVVRAGVTTENQIKESIKRLDQAGLAAKGMLFNDIKIWPGRYGHEYPYDKKLPNAVSSHKKSF